MKSLTSGGVGWSDMGFSKPRDCNGMRAKSQTRNWLPFLVLAGIAWGVPAGAVAAPTWLELRSLNFTLTTDAGEATGRQALYELEQLRAVLPTPRNSQLLRILY